MPASIKPRPLAIPSRQISRYEAVPNSQRGPRDSFATLALPPLAPRPSALHIQAAIALSELGEKRQMGDVSRCDIGIQTQPVECSSTKTRDGSKRSSCSPGRASGSKRKQEAETQTKEQKRKCLTVSSQVGIKFATPLASRIMQGRFPTSILFFLPKPYFTS